MSILTQKIDTYRGLGDPGLDNPHNYRFARIRLKRLLKFMEKCKVGTDRILDIAGPNPMSDWIKEELDCDVHGTSGDLDALDWEPTTNECNTVTMLQTIEHIMNPLLFLAVLKDQVLFEDMILSWPVRPSWLWTDIHYHEIKLDRFDALCYRAGYEIKHYEWHRVPEKWDNKFKGVRPFFRYFVNHYLLIHIKPIF